MSENTFVSIKKLPNLGELPLPSYATLDSAGMDLYAAIDTDITLKPNEPVAIPTGISIALPEGYEAQVRPRSGLALKSGISVPNSPGTIDADYRGEICVILINLSNKDFTVQRGMRVAQMVVAKYSRVNWNIVDNLDETERGEGGFGSTGITQDKKAA
jgi:dUTP pyrophosphatase